MKDLTPAHDPSERNADGKYPKARRAYRFLGAAHFVLIGVGLPAKLLREGTDPLLAVAFGLVVAIAFAAMFEHLAREHYHGRVPGKEESPQ